MLDDIASPASIAMAGPRFFGFVIGGVLPAALGANWLAGSWDQAVGRYDITPATAVLEEVSPRWMCELLVSFGDAGRNRRVIATIRAEGTCWCGPTLWRGRTAMRISVSTWQTSEQDVRRSVEAIGRVAGLV